ncbi:hypothetical protein [Helicobacter sp.]|nr:hypothetical protein [Helicobacter sp.]MDY5556539.1 hypothetical protein [Helicobacter sp.]
MHKCTPRFLAESRNAARVSVSCIEAGITKDYADIDSKESL